MEFTVRHYYARLLIIGFYAVVLNFSGLTAAPSKDSSDSIGSLVTSVVSDTAIPRIQDSLKVDAGKSIAVQKADSLSSPELTKASPLADQGQPQKLKLIKRKYNGRQQVLLATGMMIFVVGIMTMAQQWNPR